jgi:hypothetical protein
MRDWMCDQLKSVISSPSDEADPKGLDATEFEYQKKYIALAEARSGDVTKLRQLVSRLLGPEFADYIHPRKLKPGEKHPPLPNIRMVLVPLIRAIWRKHYNKWRRRPEDGFNADEIAVYYRRHIDKQP